MLNRKNKYTLFSVYLAFSLFFLLTTSIVRAEETSGMPLLEVTLNDNMYSNSGKDIRFTPEVGKEYEFVATITNSGDKAIGVKVFPSVAISNVRAIEYLEESANLMDEVYDLGNYVKVYLGEEEITGKTIEVEARESKSVRIILKIPTKIQGEILGGINFAQVLETKNNEDSVDFIQVYQKVINVRLKMSEFEEKKPNSYDDFDFSSTKETTSLDYYILNNNPFLRFSDKGEYQLINPNNEVISEGEFLTNEVVLTPFTKTKLSVPLNDYVEIIEGLYKFVTFVDDEEKTYEFKFTKEELKDFAEENKTKNNVTVNIEGESNSTILLFLIFIVVTSGLGLLIYFIKKRNR